MTPTYIMPPKPTCKVVKREGQRGARIDPKGCKVRTTKDTQGNKRQYNKRGEEVYMETFTLSDLGVFLGVVGGILTSILLTIQKSKCKNIKCCGCECDRDPTLPDPKPESEEIRP